MEAAHGNLQAQLSGCPDITFLLAISKVPKESLHSTLLGVGGVELQLFVERIFAHVDACVARELRESADDIGVFHRLLVLGLGFLHGAAKNGIDCREELDRVGVPAGSASNVASCFDLIRSLGGNEAADVDRFCVLCCEGLANLGGASLKDDAGVFYLASVSTWPFSHYLRSSLR